MNTNLASKKKRKKQRAQCKHQRKVGAYHPHTITIKNSPPSHPTARPSKPASAKPRAFSEFCFCFAYSVLCAKFVSTGPPVRLLRQRGSSPRVFGNGSNRRRGRTQQQQQQKISWQFSLHFCLMLIRLGLFWLRHSLAHIPAQAPFCLA